MKYVFIMLFVISSMALAQASEDVVTTPEAPEPMADVKGTYTPPTSAQKARVHAAAKKAKKKKSKAKTVKKTPKTKKSTQ